MFFADEFTINYSALK